MSVSGGKDPGQDLDDKLPPGSVGRPDADSTANGGLGRSPDDEDEEDEEEEEEREPNLKYTRLTSKISKIYNGGDSTSSFLVSGDKMIVGTHNGNVHVLSVASLQSIRLYHAHSSSITDISVSPYSIYVTTSTSEPASKNIPAVPTSPSLSGKATPPSNGATPPSRNNRSLPGPVPSADSIYIATASMDGHVCVSSLVDSKDVVLRNFARPVQAVALSPQYKSDRTYLSGGMAGNLILTVGGRPGVSSDANTSSAVASATSWLGAIGLGSNTGKDTILHSGEGAISSIRWSLTGKYVAWVNEQGIKVMRSGVHLDSIESDFAWKRIAHIARPNRRLWEEMAGAWKARAVWVDEKYLEYPEDIQAPSGSTEAPKTDQKLVKEMHRKRQQRVEKLLIGWGDTVWIVHVINDFARHEEILSPGKAEIIHQFVFSDGVLCGLTLYTPSLLLALVYRTRDDDDNPISSNQDNAAKGRKKRHTGLPPDLRLIDLNSADKDEVEVEGLSVVGRYETLSAGDYHLSSVFNPSLQIQQASQKSALESLSGGLWDVGVGATRLFSSGASVLSGSSGEKTSNSGVTASTPQERARNSGAELLPSMSKSGLKVFIQTPFDCVLAIRRDKSDRLNWFIDHGRFQHAWDLLNAFPDVVTPVKDVESRTSSPSRPNGSLAEFLSDDRSVRSRTRPNKAQDMAIEREKRRIGDLWIQQLVNAGDWERAGTTAGKVLGASGSWERWIWSFAQANKFDELTPYIPAERLQPPLPSMVYEVVLGHYIAKDCVKLRDLVDRWSPSLPSLFDIPTVTLAIQSKLDSREVTEVSVEDGIRGRDWHILQDCLAKLSLADGEPREALQCYIKTQHADAALQLVRDYDLMDAVSDNIYRFVTIRISQDQLKSSNIEELDKLSADSIQLLVSAALDDIISVDSVVTQLQDQGSAARPFLFLYFRALREGGSQLKGSTASSRNAARRPSMRRSRFDGIAATDQVGDALLATYGDLAVDLFAEYSRPLLADYLRFGDNYTFEHASAICEQYHYIPELVHLLRTTGETKRALHLIIDELGDVMLSINFAKEVEEDSLWDDLLNYSMGNGGKPAFIRGLLEEVGTSIDPVTLVRRIPSGLEIEGLKQGLSRLVRESEIMFSISEGAAKVLRTEVVNATQELREVRTKGVRFETSREMGSDEATEPPKLDCPTCSTPYMQVSSDSREYLMGFPCGHVYHLACLLDAITTDANKERVGKLQGQLSGPEGSIERPLRSGKVGDKMAHAQMIRAVVGLRGCLVCGGGLEDSMD